MRALGWWLAASALAAGCTASGTASGSPSDASAGETYHNDSAATVRVSACTERCAQAQVVAPHGTVRLQSRMTGYRTLLDHAVGYRGARSAGKSGRQSS